MSPFKAWPHLELSTKEHGLILVKSVNNHNLKGLIIIWGWSDHRSQVKQDMCLLTYSLSSAYGVFIAQL